MPASRTAPQLVAATRFSYSGDANPPEAIYWRYTGRRLEEGEVLRVFFRQASRWRPQLVREFETLLGTAEKPDGERTHFKETQTPRENYFDWQHLDVPSWPAGDELWIGYRARKDAALWIEHSDPGAGNIDASNPWAFVSTVKRLVRSNDPFAASFSAVPVEAGSTPPSPTRPFLFIGLFAFAAFLPALLMRGRRRWWLFIAVFLTAQLYKAMEVLFPSQWLWGGYYHARISGVWFWAGLLAVQAVTFPPAFGLLRDGLRKLRPRRLLRRPGVPYAATVAVLGVVMIAMTQTLTVRTLYGDAFGSLAHPGYDYHNPFATGIYHMFRDAKEALSKARGEPFRIIFGEINLVQEFTRWWFLPFLAIVALIARDLGRSRRERGLLLVLLLTFKPVITYFGYVEVYGPALAVQALLIWVLLRAWRTRGVLLPTALSFFGYLFQMGGAMALPAVIVLWVREAWRSPSPGRWLLSRAAATGALAILLWLNCLAVLFVFKHNSQPQSFKGHVPEKVVEWRGAEYDFHGLPMLMGSTGRPKSEVFLHWKNLDVTHSYLLPSREHATQLTGSLLFVLGPAVPWMLLAMVMVRGGARRCAARWGLTLASLAFLASAIFLSTNFPYPKDWDVFSIHALWWLVTLLWLLSRGRVLDSRATRWVLGALIAWFVWDTLPWIAYNLTWGLPPDQRRYVFF